jgi:DNA (cytosine-5)-methyltransferase 1
MGFDGPGRRPYRLTVSDTQAYRQFGNAVVVPVVEAIAQHMQPHILHNIGAPDPAVEPELPITIQVAA